MPHYEYKVIPAPSKGRKAPGVKKPDERFAHALETAMNALAADGWEYLRADILPSEERQGLTSTHMVYRSVLVFRRAFGEVYDDDELEDAEEAARYAVLEELAQADEDLSDEDEAPNRRAPPPAPKVEPRSGKDRSSAGKPAKTEPPISGAASSRLDTVYRSDAPEETPKSSDEGEKNGFGSEASEVTFTRKRDRAETPDTADKDS